MLPQSMKHIKMTTNFALRSAKTFDFSNPCIISEHLQHHLKNGNHMFKKTKKFIPKERGGGTHKQSA